MSDIVRERHRKIDEARAAEEAAQAVRDDQLRQERLEQAPAPPEQLSDWQSWMVLAAILYVIAHFVIKYW